MLVYFRSCRVLTINSMSQAFIVGISECNCSIYIHMNIQVIARTIHLAHEGVYAV